MSPKTSLNSNEDRKVRDSEEEQESDINLRLPPYSQVHEPGKAGTAYVRDSCLIRAYSEVSALEAVALKAVMVMPHLLLQKSRYRYGLKVTLTNCSLKIIPYKNNSPPALLQTPKQKNKQLKPSPN